MGDAADAAITVTIVGTTDDSDTIATTVTSATVITATADTVIAATSDTVGTAIPNTASATPLFAKAPFTRLRFAKRLSALRRSSDTRPAAVTAIATAPVGVATDATGAGAITDMVAAGEAVMVAAAVTVGTADAEVADKTELQSAS